MNHNSFSRVMIMNYVSLVSPAKSMNKESRVQRVGLKMRGFKEPHLTEVKLSGNFRRVFLVIINLTLKPPRFHQAIS